MGPILAILMFPATVCLVMLGYPVAFTLAGTAIIFASIGIISGVFDPLLLNALPGRYLGTMTNEILTAVPLFIFMGIVLEKSRIAEELLQTMSELFSEVKGGLSISVIIVGALIAASTGIVGATVVTLGLLSLPVMNKAGYDSKLSTGTICASGTLGQIIPPSTVLIFMADILQGSNQKAQLEMGNLSPDPLSVGQLFAGAMIPGLLLVLIYIAWIIIYAFLQPQACPTLKLSQEQKKNLLPRIFTTLIPPMLLIATVLGSILSGIATPTESASVGAVGAIVLAVLKQRFTFIILKQVMESTLIINSMVFIILLGASVFSLVFRGLEGEELVYNLLSNSPGGETGALLIVMLIIFLLGFFLDAFEIIFITVPIAAPILIRLGVDPIWLGVLIGMNLQTSFLTPPFGFALFYLRGVADKSIKTIDIYKGAIPFVILQLIGIITVWLMPELATWLPEYLFENQPVDFVVNNKPVVSEGEQINNIDNLKNLFSPQSSETPNYKLDQFNDLIP